MANYDNRKEVTMVINTKLYTYLDINIAGLISDFGSSFFNQTL